MFARDPGYQLNGGLPIASARGVVRHLGVDTAIVETPMTEDAAGRLAPGCGVVLRRGARQEFSGLISGDLAISFDSDGRPLIKAQLVGDNVHLDDRLALPDPARAGDAQTTADFWTSTAAASTAMQLLIAQQLGPTARAERRVPTLHMGEDAGIGAVRAWRAQFESVLEACARFSALSGANPGIRMTHTPDGLRCDIYAPRDMAGQVRFSADLSNLQGFDYTQTTPTCTYALVAGQGDLRQRIRRAATSTDPLDVRWGRRIERYIDRRDEADTAELAQAAADAITEGAGQVSLTCTLTDSQAAIYGRDWGLGDRITVYVGPAGQTTAATVVDVVREIAFEVDSTGAETLRPAIGGTAAATALPTPTQKTLAAVGRRLQGLITRK